MDRNEYETLKRRAEEEYRQNLEAIERVWAIAQANGDLLWPVIATTQPSPSAAPRRPRVPGSRGKVLGDVRAAIKHLPDTFTFSDVLKSLAVVKPGLQVKRGTLKAILKKLSETGELELVVQGIGRRPSQYRRK